MGLTDTFIKQVKQVKPAGDKYTDGQGMYLLVTSSGKYWRMDYRFLGKRKTLALGVYPEVSLAKARSRRQEARVLTACWCPTAPRRLSRASAPGSRKAWTATSCAFVTLSGRRR